MTTLPTVLRPLVQTVVPSAAELDADGWAEVEGLIARALRDRPPEVQRQARLLLAAIEWLPLLRFGRRFSRLDPSRRARVLAWLERAPLRPLRVGAWGLRTLALLGWYGRPAGAWATGWLPDRRGWEAR